MQSAYASTSNLEEKSQFLESICKKFPVDLGEEISWKSDTIYGEITFPTLSQIFTRLNELLVIRDGGVFYDLGSGIGKAVVSASFLHNFSACVGIELIPSLHELALRLKHKYLKHIKSVPFSHSQNTEISFINGDIFEVDWTNATVFFVNSTCFDSESFEKLSRYPVNAGTIGITTTKRLPKQFWQLLHTSHQQMTWGKAKVFIHKRL